MPEKPSFNELRIRKSIDPLKVPEVLDGWGKPDQGVAPLLTSSIKPLPKQVQQTITTPTPSKSKGKKNQRNTPQSQGHESPSTPKTKVHQSIISPSGSHIVSEIRKLSKNLVSSVREEIQFMDQPPEVRIKEQAGVVKETPKEEGKAQE
jgi:hypothetical protein